MRFTAKDVDEEFTTTWASNPVGSRVRASSLGVNMMHLEPFLLDTSASACYAASMKHSLLTLLLVLGGNSIGCGPKCQCATQPETPESSAPLPNTFSESKGVLLSLEGCWRQNRNEVRCEVMATSPKIDRRLDPCRTEAFDDRGNKYSGSGATFGGKGLQCVGHSSAVLADIPVKVAFVFRNVASDATVLSALTLQKARFTGIPIQSEPANNALPPEAGATAEPAAVTQ